MNIRLKSRRGFLVMIFIISFFSLESQVPAKSNPQKSVTIGSQTWMKENLAVSTFRNGEAIPEAKTHDDWENARINKTPVWSYYNFDKTNYGKYGKLYNWYAVNDSRGLAPQGWHIPTNDEWTQLTDFLGGKGIAGKKIKSKTGWNKNGNGTNESGFNAIPSGLHDHGKFSYQGFYSGFWCSSPHFTDNAWLRSFVYDSNSFNKEDDDFDVGLSVRCIKD
jgi:uncharacterized protein (TIGR02145 family)